MSKVSIFELNSNLAVEEIGGRLVDCKLESEVTGLTDKQLNDPNICQSKRVEVYVSVYESADTESAIFRELERMANTLLDVSDGEVFYYRSSHAQEKDAEEESISSSDLWRFPPTMHEPHTKRYVIRRRPVVEE